VQWCRQDFVTGGGSEVWVDRGSRVRSPPEADTFTAVHREFVGFGICRVIRRSSITMKAHAYYIIFRRPPIGGKLPPFPPGGATDCVVPYGMSVPVAVRRVANRVRLLTVRTRTWHRRQYSHH